MKSGLEARSVSLRRNAMRRLPASTERLRGPFRLPDAFQESRKLKALVLVSASFFILWLGFQMFAPDGFWPLLAVPVLLSAWFFYETGLVVTVAVAVGLLMLAPPENAGPAIIAIVTFTAIGLGMSAALKRQQQTHKHVLKSSLTDPLTGLYNYGYFMKTLDREMHRAERYGGSVTLVMLDLDYFKKFNDRYGHQAGNEALKAVAVELKRQKRESDIAARYGGEEFALLLPGDEAAGIETAGRMRRAIAQIRIPVDGATASVTVSAGVASYPRGAQSKEELLERADQLLYSSKKNGRNRIAVAPLTGRRLAV